MPAPEPRLARSLGVRRLLLAARRRYEGRPRHPIPTLANLLELQPHRRAPDFRASWGRPLCGLCKPENPLTPSRLVVACERGHIDDFPYFRWLHAGTDASADGQHEMRLVAPRAELELADMELSCSCDVRPRPRALDGAPSKAERSPGCTGAPELDRG